MYLVKQAKLLYILCSVLLCLSGAAIVVFPGMSAKVVCYILGGVLLLFGAAKFVGYFSKDPYRLAFQFDLALGVLSVILAALLLWQPRLVLGAFELLLGFFVLVDGALKLQTAVEAKRFGLGIWWLILVCALLCILFGAALLFLGERVANVIGFAIGLALIFDGAQNLLAAFYTARAVKQARLNADSTQATE